MINSTQFAGLAGTALELPAEGVGRDRKLLRLTDLYAATEALAALHAAAARTQGQDGALPRALTSAGAVLRGRIEERGLWTDDATSRDQLFEAVTSVDFLSLVPGWIRDLREIAASRPATGACTLASALDLWLWTVKHFRALDPASGVLDEMTETVAPLLAARCLVLEIAQEGPSSAPEKVSFRSDLCQVHVARSAAQAGAACAEAVFGYRRHLSWDAEGCATCFDGDEIDDLEALIPGMATGARMTANVVEADGTHPRKAGPCARFDGVESFTSLRRKLDGCLTGSRVARDRAAAAIARSMAATAEARD